jgi:hypothetical protein
MLRSAFVVFLLGWVVWFLIDKPPPGQMQLPAVSDSLTENFQVAFNMLKAGYLDVAFVYIWQAHYLLLSLLGGALTAVLYGVISDYLSRRRMRRNFMPPVRKKENAGEKDSASEQQDSPS